MFRLLATVLSAVFHPLLVPSYLFYLVCYQLPGVVAQPALPDRWLVLAVVWGLTFGLPAVGTAIMLRLGLVSSLELRERRQRAWPLLLAALSFGAAAGLLYRPGSYDLLLPQILASMSLAVLLTFVITLRWKISAHGVGMGGGSGLLALLYLTGQTGPVGQPWMLLGIGLAVAVGWARLKLSAHTPAQVVAGLALGLSLTMGLGAWFGLG